MVISKKKYYYPREEYLIYYTSVDGDPIDANGAFQSGIGSRYWDIRPKGSRHISDNLWAWVFDSPPTKVKGDVNDMEGLSANTNLKSIDFSGCESLRIIGSQAFCECSNLESVTFNEGLTTILPMAFDSTGIKSITFPSTLQLLYKASFASNRYLETVTFNVGMEFTDIAGDAYDGTFVGCTALRTVTLPTSVDTIIAGTFRNCTSLASVNLPSSIESIESQAFDGCSGLNTIAYDGTMAEWNAITKASNWHNGVPATVVHCTDGDITL